MSGFPPTRVFEMAYGTSTRISARQTCWERSSPVHVPPSMTRRNAARRGFHPPETPILAGVGCCSAADAVSAEYCRFILCARPKRTRFLECFLRKIKRHFKRVFTVVGGGSHRGVFRGPRTRSHSARMAARGRSRARPSSTKGSSSHLNH